jgi:hypothetical protein
LERFSEATGFARLQFRRADLLGYLPVDEDRKRRPELAAGGQAHAAGGEGLPELPRLPERAAIYIAPDGTVHFGALFEGLVPVAEALRAPAPAAATASRDFE